MPQFRTSQWEDLWTQSAITCVSTPQGYSFTLDVQLICSDIPLKHKAYCINGVCNNKYWLFVQSLKERTSIDIKNNVFDTFFWQKKQMGFRVKGTDRVG